MKRFLTIIALTILAFGTKAQIKNDTLNVPIGKYKFIKIGDRVYEIETKLKEVEQGISHSRMTYYDSTKFYFPYHENIYLLKGTITVDSSFAKPYPFNNLLYHEIK